MSPVSRFVTTLVGASAFLAMAHSARAAVSPMAWPDAEAHSLALPDRSLAEVRGGQRIVPMERYQGDLEVMSRAQNRYEFAALAGISREQMDVWWASDGFDLIAANILR